MDICKKQVIATNLVIEELIRANDKKSLFNSVHEGYAVLKEEVDELWDTIKSDSHNLKIKEEAIQVGAMAIKFLISCCELEE